MNRKCPKCGQLNRIPLERLADVGRCGACQAALPALDEPLDVDATEFDTIVNSAKVPVLVDFWATWCPPCRMAAPHVKKVAKNQAGRAVVLKVNTEEVPTLAGRFQIRSIPTFMVLVGGQVVQATPGLVDHQQMERWIADASTKPAV